MNLSKPMAAFVTALGCREGDSDILPAMGVLGEPFDTEEFEGWPRATYYSFWNSGVEFMFEEDILESISFFLHDPPQPGYAIFDGLAEMWAGLAASPDRETLLALLGQPEAHEEESAWVRFDQGGWLVHAEVDRQERIRTLTLLRGTAEL